MFLTEILKKGGNFLKIISVTDLSRPGNDVYINEELALIESKGEYYIAKTVNITGWTDHKEMYIVDIPRTTKLLDAIKWYKSQGGIYNE